jgi:hypothetical protein
LGVDITITQRVNQLGLGHSRVPADIQLVGPLKQFLPLPVAIRTRGAVFAVAAFALVLTTGWPAIESCSGHGLLLLPERFSSGAVFYPGGSGLHGAIAPAAGLPGGPLPRFG